MGEVQVVEVVLVVVALFRLGPYGRDGYLREGEGLLGVEEQVVLLLLVVLPHGARRQQLGHLGPTGELRCLWDRSVRSIVDR